MYTWFTRWMGGLLLGGRREFSPARSNPSPIISICLFPKASLNHFQIRPLRMSSDFSFEAVSRSHGFQQPSLMLANSTNCRQSLSHSGCSDPSWAGSGISSLVGVGGSSDRQKRFFWARVGGGCFLRDNTGMCTCGSDSGALLTRP